MSDMRRKTRLRLQTLTLRLHPEEIDRLRQLAEENHRTPGDQVRSLIADAPLKSEPTHG